MASLLRYRGTSGQSPEGPGEDTAVFCCDAGVKAACTTVRQSHVSGALSHRLFVYISISNSIPHLDDTWILYCTPRVMVNAGNDA